MAVDLETLRTEIKTYLEGTDLGVFYGYHRMPDELSRVDWDTEQHPDFREFVQVALKAGAKLAIFHHATFSLDVIDEALEELEEADFSREEKRQFENRLRELQAYEGFTCAVELSFAMDGKLYMYERHTPWYETLSDILEELEAATGEASEDEGEPLGGYFSNN